MKGWCRLSRKHLTRSGTIGVSYSKEIADAGLGTALLKNQSGNFLLPTKDAVEAAAAGLGSRTPADQRLTIVLAPGDNAYPLISYEYAVVSTKQPSADVAAALRKFLIWSIVPSEANEGYLDSVHFIPLPAQIFALSEAQIQNIKYRPKHPPSLKLAAPVRGAANGRGSVETSSCSSLVGRGSRTTL